MAAGKTKEPTRRQAVVALGAGLIGGTMDLTGVQPPKKQPTPPPSAAKAQTPPKPEPPKKCSDKPTTEAYVDVAGRRQLQLSSCCEYVNDVLNQGYTNAHADAKSALKRFMTLLAAEKNLLDYCFIQFDVKKEKIEQLKTTVANVLQG
jgi:hypothetical protein